MARVSKIDLDNPTSVDDEEDEEDEETLAAIDEGIRDVEARRCPKAPSQLDYRILFSQRALSDLSVGHFELDDNEAGTRFGEALFDHVDLLGRFPRIGNIIRKRSRVR